MQASSVVSLSPSFNSYSNTKMAEIAARVVGEFGSQELYDDEFYFEREEISAAQRSEEGGNSDYVRREREIRAEDEGGCEFVERGGGNRADSEEEFEFAFVTRDSELPSPISADEIFYNGQIRPVYPVFDRDLFLQSMGFPRENRKEEGEHKKAPAIRLPLRKLFNEERETAMTMATTSSCSSSDADDLDGIPADSYCVWRPEAAAAAAEGLRKKSNSTGSNSKRWKLKVKDLLHRSPSDGIKDDFVILSPSNSGRKKRSEDSGNVTPVSAGKVKSTAAPPLPPTLEHSRDGGEKRRTYLPYRQDLVGLFANVNGLSKNLQPF